MKSIRAQYYKLRKNLDVNLKPYRIASMYDENPDLGVYHSTLYVPHPKKGDYLIYNNGDITFSSAYRDFHEVYFDYKIPLEDLIKRQVIHEISSEVYESDFKLSNDIKEIYENISFLEFGLDFIKDAREDIEYNEEKIKEDEKKFVDLKSILYALERIQISLSECNDPILEKILINSCLKIQ